RLQRESPDDLAVSAVTLAEAWTGAAKTPRPASVRRAWDYLVRPLRVLDFDARAADHYSQVRARLERRGRMIGGNDSLIAATALAHGLIAVTTDVEEFSRVPGLEVEDWSEPEG